MVEPLYRVQSINSYCVFPRSFPSRYPEPEDDLARGVTLLQRWSVVEPAHTPTAAVRLERLLLCSPMPQATTIHVRVFLFVFTTNRAQ